MIRLAALPLVMLAGVAPPPSEQCRIERSGAFNGNGERVRLARGIAARTPFAVFRAPLAINTDGAPTSYHPEDFFGTTRAINRIDNGVVIRRVDGTKLTVTEKRAVFARWYAADFAPLPGYRITWGNVIAARDGKPCVFRSGAEKGYFGSLTALKQDLPIDRRGECDRFNQVDLRDIPAIALRGTTTNPLYAFGARKGDLVLAINPVSRTTVAAIIGDTGDANRIGEGSVALNMRLLGRTIQPRTYTEAITLDTGHRDMVVAVLPATKDWHRQTPFTAANIGIRLGEWATANGYGTTAALADRVLDCSDGL
jgi:hypothetical protein